jgi:hypothetical protein
MKYVIFLTIILSLESFLANNEERIAILIANQNYKIIPKLKNPLNDIAELKSFCLKEKYKVLEFSDLCLSEFNIMLDSIERSIPVNKKVKIFVHYSGHGIQFGNTNFFVPVDCEMIENKNQLDRKCFSIKKFLGVFSDLINKNNQINGLISFDACRENPFEFNKEVDGLYTGLDTDNHVYNHFDFIYSASFGKTADDGRGKTSPYVTGLVKGLYNCFDLNGIIQQIEVQYKLENIDAIPALTGYRFHFCESSNNNLQKNNISTEIIYDLYFSILNDYKNGDFIKVALKDSLLQIFLKKEINHEILSNKELLQLSLISGVSLIEKGFILEGITKLLSVFNSAGSPDTYAVYCEAYYLLTNRYRENKNWTELQKIRLSRIEYLKGKGLYLDLAITYDDMALDFEKQNKQNEALNLYKKALEVYDNLADSTEHYLHYKFLTLCNLGNCYGQGLYNNVDSSVFYLEKSINLNGISNEDWYYAMFSIVGKVIDKPNSQDNYDYLNKLLDTIISRGDFYYSEKNLFYYNDFALSIASKYCKSSKIIEYHKKAYNQISSKINYSNFEDISIEKNINDHCRSEFRKINITIENNTMPILFFDVNSNNLFDPQDIKIEMANSNIDSTIDNLVGQNANEFKLESKKSIEGNKVESFELFYGINKLEGSYCIASTKNGVTSWKWSINCSEVPIKNMNLFIGLENLVISFDNQEIILDDVIQYYPIVNLNQKCETYSLSTFEKRN